MELACFKSVLEKENELLNSSSQLGIINLRYKGLIQCKVSLHDIRVGHRYETAEESVEDGDGGGDDDRSHAHALHRRGRD